MGSLLPREETGLARASRPAELWEVSLASFSRASPPVVQAHTIPPASHLHPSILSQSWARGAGTVP